MSAANSYEEKRSPSSQSHQLSASPAMAASGSTSEDVLTPGMALVRAAPRLVLLPQTEAPSMASPRTPRKSSMYTPRKHRGHTPQSAAQVAQWSEQREAADSNFHTLALGLLAAGFGIPSAFFAYEDGNTGGMGLAIVCSLWGVWSAGAIIMQPSPTRTPRMPDLI